MNELVELRAQLGRLKGAPIYLKANLIEAAVDAAVCCIAALEARIVLLELELSKRKVEHGGSE